MIDDFERESAARRGRIAALEVMALVFSVFALAISVWAWVR